MKFSYLKFPKPERFDLFGKSLLRPVIPIRVGTQKHFLHYEALIDSGADFCIFDAEVGEAIGIDVRNGEEARFGGVQGLMSSKAYIHEVILMIGD